LNGVEIIDYHGISIALVSVDEAASRHWRSFDEPVDVVRVERPEPAHWPELRSAGFIPKPQFLTWITDARGSEEEYFATLPKRERQKIRGGRRQLQAEGLVIEVAAVDEPLFDSFLKLYEQQIGEMRHGVLMATEQRELVLGDADAYRAICAYREGVLVGCCIAQPDEGTDIMRVRWSAVAPEYRAMNLPRVLYMEAAELTRRGGHSGFSLGTDRNLYGHLANPGLYRFKSHLGLVPHPSHFLYPESGYDQADLVLRLGELTDPTLVLGYADEKPSERLRLHVYSARAEVPLDADQAPCLHDARLHVLEAHAEHV
jgi:GNAT superfamily N-acetyltransferase